MNAVLGVPILNPGSNRQQVSRLRVVNLDSFPTYDGIPLLPFDDRGIWSELVTAGLPALPARASLSFSSADLEGLTSSNLLTRTLGDGTGKQRLLVESEQPLRANWHRSINAQMHDPRQAVVDLLALGYRLFQLSIRPLAYSSLMTTEDSPWMQVVAALIGNKSCHFSPKVGKFLTSFR